MYRNLLSSRMASSDGDKKLNDTIKGLTTFVLEMSNLTIKDLTFRNPTAIRHTEVKVYNDAARKLWPATIKKGSLSPMEPLLRFTLKAKLIMKEKCNTSLLIFGHQRNLHYLENCKICIGDIFHG